ncbi:MAG: tetratricopeptide repeat protein [Chitinophagaceae bacterium]
MEMKKILLPIAIICSLKTFGQNSQDYLQRGIEKHKQQDFKGAIKEYDLAIKEDKTNRDAYYNRGNCELAVKDFQSATADFSKAIELDPDFEKAYYGRASVSVSQEKYVNALADLDKTIDLDPSTPNALTLRGQIRAQSGNKEGACEDFNKAKQIGDKQADKYISQYCDNTQLTVESLMLDWPDNENWKVGSSQENEKIALVEMIHSDETLESWTEIGTMMSIKGAKNIPMDQAMTMMFDQAKQHAPNAKLTFIEKDENVTYPWIIFMIESPGFKEDNTPESQLWYITQGKTALYTNFRAVKQSSIRPEQKRKWTSFFKTGRVVYR